MADLTRVKELVDKALCEFDDPSTSTGKTLRACLRIAQMRNDFPNLFRLELEADDLTGERSHAAERARRRNDLGAHFNADEWDSLCQDALEDYFRRRAVKDGHYGGSVDNLESLIARLKSQAENAVAPDGLAPLDLYHRSKELHKLQLALVAESAKFEHVRDRTRSLMHQFLLDAERELDFGQVNADIFARNREFVDTQMASVSPDALMQFQAAYRRIKEGDVESLTHALTSCRRVLKSVADSLYPASPVPIQGRDGRERVLTDAQYINRLIQFVSERIGKHGDGAVIQATLDALGGRLKALDALASKGVHAEVTADEVDTCVIQTYLAMGDILRVNAGTSMLTDDPAKS
ncbi:hypothetical protein [Micromonospora ureilytica]|uniref:hypothetical protein n=1 Tax=Micromonospora ureilytica TaxID=709868 RepID=UPI002E10C20B|nr:hypothetical protein OHB55_08000 [Micromonospora ureilytica]